MKRKLVFSPGGSSAYLVDTFLPARHVATPIADALKIVAGSVLIALGAQISIPLPFTPVPITGQTFTLLLVAMLLGPTRGALATSLYLLEGAVGLPVFAGGASGIAKFVGPTGGYLAAFPLGALLCGFLARRGWDRTPIGAGVAMHLGSLLILTIGTLWLSLFVGGVSAALSQGLIPFLPGEVVKVTIAALLLPAAWKATPKK